MRYEEPDLGGQAVVVSQIAEDSYNPISFCFSSGLAGSLLTSPYVAQNYTAPTFRNKSLAFRQPSDPITPTPLQ